MKTLQDIANIIHINHSWYILIVPCALAACDYLSGFIKAWRDKNIQSGKLREGLSKKFGEMLIIIISLFLQYSIGLPEEISSFIAIYVSLTELISILENLSKLGVKVPEWLSKRLADISEEIDKNE